MAKIALILGVGLFVASCATSYQPMYSYNEILVSNDTERSLGDVRISVGESGMSLDCDRIAAKGYCSRRFGKRRYPYQPIVVSWVTEQDSRQSREFEPVIPSFYSTAFALRILLEFDRDGTLSLRFSQVEPFRGND